MFCQLLQDVEYSQPFHAMVNESETNNNQIVLFKTVRERPFNLKGRGGGGGYFFFLKKYSDSQCC